MTETSAVGVFWEYGTPRFDAFAFLADFEVGGQRTALCLDRPRSLVLLTAFVPFRTLMAR